MMRSFWRSAFLMLGLVVAGASALANSIAVDVSGYGTTRDQALGDAQRAAVESGLGSAITTESYVKDFVLQSDRVHSISSGVVKSFTITKEDFKDGMWEVYIHAIVDENKLNGNINTLLSQIDNPVSVITISPVQRGLSTQAAAARTQLSQQLLKQGFKIISQDISAELREDVASIMDVAMYTKTAASLALKHNAEVVWLLSLTETKGAVTYGVQDMIANITCQVVNTTTGDIFAEAIVSGHGLNIDKAIGKGVEELAAELVNQVKVRFADQAQQGSVFTIRLWKVPGYRLVRDFKKALTQLPGVRNIKQVSIALEDDPESSFVEFSLGYRGTSGELLDGIYDQLPDSLESLDVRLQKGNQLELEL
ncbi:MAG: hypothetical protein KDI36_04130 [Pseudomonadales bacterium]|nr:hypothetical protein [Pseudomonadales bacterium]